MNDMPTGLTKDAGWQIGVSRTLPHPPAVVWDFVGGRDGLALWLGAGADLEPRRGGLYRTADGTEGEVRGYRAGDRIRVTYGTTVVQVALRPAGDGSRTRITLHQERMAGPEERERRRAHWQRVMDDIAAALDRRR